MTLPISHQPRNQNKDMRKEYFEKIIAHVNRKDWWHVAPRDPDAYKKRGKFLSSSYGEAEFWGRPLDEPEKVSIAHPLIGDDEAIEKILFGRRVSDQDIEMDERFKLDAKIKKVALSKGYDSIVIMTPKAFAEFNSTGKLPRSLELNILDVSVRGNQLGGKNDRTRTL